MKHTVLGLTLLLVACQGDDKDPVSPAGSSQQLRCGHDQLESDLDSSPWMGAAVDAESNKLELEAGKTYVVSSTYGVPQRDDPKGPPPARYLEIFGAIEQQLQAQPGLLALKLASSDECGSGRTLAIWQSQEEMYEFVTSPAHFKAMNAVNDLLHPGYAVTHWETSSREQMTLEEAVRQLHQAGAD